MHGVRGGEHPSSLRDTLIGEAVVDVVRREQSDATVAVFAVVLAEE
jgi:hypothetical protein